MKKFILFTTGILLSVFGFSQQTWFDFEGGASPVVTAAYSYGGNTYNGAVANPSATGVNTSANVGSFDRDGTQTFAASVFTANNGEFFEDLSAYETGTKTITADVYFPTAGEFEIEFFNDSAESSASQAGEQIVFRGTAAQANTWETITLAFVFRPNTNVPLNRLDRVDFKFDNGTNNAGTYYIDNFVGPDLASGTVVTPPPAPALIFSENFESDPATSVTSGNYTTSEGCSQFKIDADSLGTFNFFDYFLASDVALARQTKLYVKAKSSQAGDILRIDLVDSSGRATNANANAVTLTSSYQVYTLDFANKFTDQFGANPGPLDTTAIRSLSMALNAASGSPFGDVMIDWISFGDTLPFGPTNFGPSAFSLTSPADGTVLEVTGPTNTPVVIDWADAMTACDTITYIWHATPRGAGFANPAVSLTSDNNGMMSQLSLTFGAIDGVLNSLGLNQGDTAMLDWTVTVENKLGEVVFSSDVFAIDLIRGEIDPLTDFNLVSPPDGLSLLVTGSPNQVATIDWTATTDPTGGTPTYEWLANTPGMGFNPAFVTLPSGTASTIAVPFRALDSLMNLAAVSVGDSVTLEWTVKATSGSKMKFANDTFEITLIRGTLVQNLSEFSIANDVKIFPNPANQNINLMIDFKEATNFNIQLTDMSGRVIRERVFGFVNGVNDQLNVSDLESGIYLLNLNAGGDNYVQKIIKR